MANMPPPPPGFTLDSGSSTPPPPPGFKLDDDSLKPRSFTQSVKDRAGGYIDEIKAVYNREPTTPEKGETGGQYASRAMKRDLADGMQFVPKVAGAAWGIPASIPGAIGETAERKAAQMAGVPTAQAEKLARDTGDVSESLIMMLPGGKVPMKAATMADTAGAEKIASAAIKDGEKVYTGDNHENIRQSMPEGSKKGADADTGFVTDKGRFVSREEADKIAKAQGQFKEEIKGKDQLHSEELIKPTQKSKIFSDDQPVASTKPIATTEGVADKLYQSRQGIRADYKEFTKWASQFKGIPEGFWQKALDHLDDPKGTPLSPEEKLIFDRSVGTMRDEINANRAEIKAAGFDPEYLDVQSEGLGGAIRQRIGAGTPMDKLTGTKTAARAPEGGQSLSRSAGTFKNRNMMAITRDGKRQIVHIDKDGNIFDASKQGDPIGRVDETTKAATMADGKPAKLGEATRKEIEQATKGDIKYHDNAFGVYATSLLQTRRAVRSVRILNDIKQSPDFNLVAHSPFSKGEVPKGWKEIPDLPAFRGWRFEPKYAEEIEDFASGVKRDSGGLGFADKLNRFVLSTLFWANPIHAFNINNAFLVTKGAGNLLKDIPGTTGDLLKSIKSVATRDKYNMQQARAGVPMPGLDTAGEEFRKMTLDIMGVKARQDYPGFVKFAKEFGYDDPKAFFQKVSELSHKAVFSWQDILQQTLERGYVRQGLSQAEATKKVAETFMNYRTPARVMDQRWMGQALQGQAWLDFPKYSYGRLKGMYNILKGSAKLDPHSIDQLLTIGMLYEFGQHAINPLIQKYTQNSNAEFGDFGYSIFPKTIADLVEGKRSPGQAVQGLLSPGYAVQGLDMARGVNPYLGKPISVPGETPGQIGFDYANELANKLSPFQRFGQVASGKLTPDDIWLEQLGVKFPSDLPKSVQKQLKYRSKYGNTLENELTQ